MNAKLQRIFARLSIVLIILLLLGFGAPTWVEAAGPLCYVNDNAGGINNGTSWTDAYTDLQSALGDTGCTEIWVAAGTYKPTTGAERLVSFVLKNSVSVYGGFSGTETQLEQRDWVLNETTLSGDLNGDDAVFTNNGENSYHVVNAGSTDNSAVLDGFTIRGGNADNAASFPHNAGGGMLSDGSAPTLANLTFNGNTALNYGGGMSNLNSSSPLLTNVTFSSNHAADLGGGMYNSSSSPTLTDATFSNNTALNGGGMYNISSSPALTNTTFNSNTATNYGGGMYNSASSPTLTSVTFSDNTTTNYGGGMSNLGNSSPILTTVTFSGNTADLGGGMYNSVSSPTLTDVTFSSNTAPSGSGMYNVSSSPTLTNATFSGNTATNYGGGMYNVSSSPALTNVTFSGNTASNGGGAYNYSASNPTLTNVTFSGNTATNYGGGMYNYVNSNPTLTNVIFSTNGASNNGGGIYNRDSSPALTNVTLNGNTATNYGGGVYNRTSSPALTNVTFSGNTASKGGGIYNYSASNPTLTNATFSGNSTSSSGGGIYNDGSSPIINDVIFWGNGTEVYNLTSIPTITDSVVQGGCPVGATCTNIITGDPVLGLLRNNGGYTETMALGASGSAIDTGGANSTCAATDQRGVSRPIDGNGDTLALCDIGAYEYDPPPIYTLTVSKEGNGGGTVTSSPPGIDCGEDCSEVYVSGIPVSLTATPVEGSVFNGWSGDADCLDGSVTMDASQACLATFDPGLTTTTNVDCGTGVPIVTYGGDIACIVTVTASSGTSSPTGTVSWTTNEAGAFVDTSCTLSGSGGSASCSVLYTPGTVGSGSHSIAANYAGGGIFLSSSGDQSVTVNKKAASVTPNTAGKSYSDTDPVLTGTLDGFLTSDGVSAAYSRAAGEDVGTYAINATLSPVEVLANYEVIYHTADFTITSASAVVTLSNLVQVYDGTPKSVTVTTNPPDLSVSVTYDGSPTPPTAVGSYAVNAIVTDPNYTGSASDTFLIQAKHSLALLPGWNLVSFNVHPADTSIETVLASLNGNYDLVYAWDASGAHSADGNWMTYDPAAPPYANSLFALDETMGFWVRMTSADTLEVTGSAPVTTAIQLLDNAGGWNLVSYASLANRDLPDALQLQGVGTDFTVVYAYHANDPASPWKLFDREGPPFANDLTELSPGWGYWIKVTADHTWTIPFLPD